MAAVVKTHSAWALIIACGKSEQISSDVDTAFLQLGEQPVLAHSLVAFERSSEIDGIVVVAPKDRLDAVVGMARMFGTPKLKKIVGGAIQKTASIKAGLKAMDDVGASIVVIHEASQPCVTPAVVSEVVKNAKRYGVATAAEKLEQGVAIVPKGLKATKCLNAGPVWGIHMPVAAKLDDLSKALGLGKSTAKVDDDKFYEKLYAGAYMVQLDRFNHRIRSLADIQIVAAAFRP